MVTADGSSTPRGDLLPALRGSLPGPITQKLVDALAAVECPGLTARRKRREERSGAPHDPLVWASARGSNVTDVDGNRFVDMTAGFGAALLGHGHPSVVEAVIEQAEVMLHALGDVAPSEEKIVLETRLAALAPWPARVVLGLSGADAVEAALKTAVLHTGRPGVLAFEGGYHGLSYGALAACGYSAGFRAPFAGQLNAAVDFAPYPRDLEGEGVSLDAVERSLATGTVGAVIVEPVQGRGGVIVPPAGFLRGLEERCRAFGALLIADEIQTGLGRAGAMLRSVSDGCTPDVITLGKALGGGLPVSACLMREEVARAWADRGGEAIHTSTFLGNPLGCAAALASLDVLDTDETRERIAATAATLTEGLRALRGDPGLGITRVDSAGLMIGVGIGGPEGRGLAVMRGLLERGYVTLCGGAKADALTLTPPCSLTDEQVSGFCAALREALRGQ